MLKLLVISFLIMLVVAMAVMVLMTLFFVAMACLAVGVPVWLLMKYWGAGSRRIPVVAQHPIDRLKNLYIDGKIDLFEFERAVAHLVAVEK